MQFKIGYADLDYIPKTDYKITCCMTSNKLIFFHFDKVSRNDSYRLMGYEKFFKFVRDYLINGRGMKFRNGVPGHTIGFKHIRIDTVDESAYKIARTVAGILTLEQQDLQNTDMYLNYDLSFVKDSQTQEEGLYLNITYYSEDKNVTKEEVLETLRNSNEPNDQNALKDIQNGQPTVVYYTEFVKGGNDGFCIEVRSESFNMEPKCYVLRNN
jgi:hypothetical protein